MSTTRKILSTLTIVAVTTTAGLSVISNAQAHYSPWLHSHDVPGLVGPGPATVEPTPVPGAVGPAPRVVIPELDLREDPPRRRNRRSWAVPK